MIPEGAAYWVPPLKPRPRPDLFRDRRIMILPTPPRTYAEWIPLVAGLTIANFGMLSFVISFMSTAAYR